MITQLINRLRQGKCEHDVPGNYPKTTICTTCRVAIVRYLEGQVFGVDVKLSLEQVEVNGFTTLTLVERSLSGARVYFGGRWWDVAGHQVKTILTVSTLPATAVQSGQLR